MHLSQVRQVGVHHHLDQVYEERGRELEMRVEDHPQRVKLTALIQRGYDYDRVSFSSAG